MKIVIGLLLIFSSAMSFAEGREMADSATEAGAADCPDGTCKNAVFAQSRARMSREEAIKIAEALLEKHETPKLPAQDDSKTVKEGR